jgi:hypothetical protein
MLDGQNDSNSVGQPMLPRVYVEQPKYLISTLNNVTIVTMNRLMSSELKEHLGRVAGDKEKCIHSLMEKLPTY